MGSTAIVSKLPPCDLAPEHGNAYADARLPAIGSWAYVCRPCFDRQGCSLGTGHGQVLIVPDGTL